MKAEKPAKVITEKDLEDMKKNPPSKMPRINIAFRPDTYDYLRTVSRLMGITQTDFVNALILKHKEENLEMYKKALEYRETLK